MKKISTNFNAGGTDSRTCRDVARRVSQATICSLFDKLRVGFLICFLICATTLSAQTIQEWYIGYPIAANVKATLSGSGNNLTLTISGTGAMMDFSNTSDQPWASQRTSINSVVINNGVTSIGRHAFNGSGLKSVSIPNSLTSIGNYAFSGCSGLTSITIPNGVTSIGVDAFARCSSLTSVTFPNSVTEIGSQAFAECNGLTSLTIPEGLQYIGYCAFIGCANLITVNYNAIDCSTLMSGNVFPGCPKLTTINIGNNVTSIPYGMFAYCENLTSITIPNNVLSIGREAFYRCTNLLSITIGNHVAEIGYGAFSFCTRLTTVTNLRSFPQNRSVRDIFIGDVLGGNASLGNITLYVPQSSMPGYQEWGSSFKQILAAPGIPSNTWFIGSPIASDIIATLSNGTLTINGTGAMADFYSSVNASWSSIEIVIIESGVTSIGNYAFSGCTNLTAITIENSVTSIGERAFQSCTGLISVTIPNSVTEIGGLAFSGCTSLKKLTIDDDASALTLNTVGYFSIPFTGCNIDEVYIGRNVNRNSNNESALFGTTVKTISFGNSVTEITEFAFSYCTSLTSITIPENVTSIGNNAFNRCSGLTEVVNQATTPQTINANVFTLVNKNTCVLRVPAASVDDYQAKDVWKDFKNIFAIGGTKKVTVGAQNGTINAGKAGLVTFLVTTENIISGSTITLNNTNSVDISLGTNTTAGNSTTVRINTTASTEQGTHPLTITIDGVTSASFDFVVLAAITPPFSPQNFQAAPGNTQVTLSWIAPASDGGSPITGYQVSRDDGANWEPTLSNNSHTFTGLTNGTTYTFCVRAVNIVGNGESVCVTATPQAPFVPIDRIIGVPTTATATLPLTLTGTVEPTNATNKSPIVWSIVNPGTTGAYISGLNTLITTGAGTVKVRVSIANGKTPTTPYEQDFDITVSLSALGGTVTVNGNAIFGNTLTTTVSLNSTPVIPNLGTVRYQWRRGSANISGATSATYTLVQADIGNQISVEVSADNCIGNVTSYNTSPVSKAPQSAPPIPALVSITQTNIALITVTGCEYRINDGAWQSSPEFTGLTPNTSYKLSQRFAETATHLASSELEIWYTTPGPTYIPVFDLTNVPTDATATLPLSLNGTVTPDNASYQAITWSIFDAGTTGAEIIGTNILTTTGEGWIALNATIENGLTESTPWMGGFSIFVSQADLSGMVYVTGNAEFGQTLTVNTEGLFSIPEIPNLGEIRYQWRRGTVNIEGATSQNYTLVQEDTYSQIDVVVTAANCSGEVTSINVSAPSKASQPVPVTAALQASTPTSIMLVYVSGCEYSLWGGEWQSSPEFTGLSPNSSYIFTQRYAETDTHLASPESAAVWLTTERDMTDISELTRPNPLKAWIHNSVLYVTGLTIGETLSIYNTVGLLVFKNIAHSDEMEITLPGQGMYILRSGENTIKVAMNRSN